MFYVGHPVFPSAILFMLLQHSLWTHPVLRRFINFAYTDKTFEIYHYAKNLETRSMPWSTFKMLKCLNAQLEHEKFYLVGVINVGGGDKTLVVEVYWKEFCQVGGENEQIFG